LLYFIVFQSKPQTGFADRDIKDNFAGFDWQTFIELACFVACLIEEIKPIIFYGRIDLIWNGSKDISGYAAKNLWF
jgi:hypothetical protein